MSSIRISQLNDFSIVKAEDFVPLVDSSSLTTYRVTVTSFGGWFADSGSVLSASYASSSRISLSSSWASSSISSSTANSLIWPNTTSASYSVNSLSSSWADRSGAAITASAVAGTASFASFAKTSSYAGTSSVAITASYVNFALGVPPTSSFAHSASWADNLISSSYAKTASWAGQAVTALTASYIATSNSIITKNFSNIGGTWWVANPGGAFAVGNDLYVYNYSRTNARRNLVKIDMQTNEATYKHQWPTDGWNFYGRAMRREEDGDLHMLAFFDTGLYDYNVTDNTAPSLISGVGGYYYDLPVLVTNWNSLTQPSVLCLYGSDNAGTYGNAPDLRWRRHYYNVSWQHDFASATINLDSCTDNTEYRKFINFGTDPGDQQDTLMWDFNPIKQRYYLIDDSSGYMHIFEHTTGNITSSWLSTSITYIKSYAVPLAHAAPNSDTATEKVTVDYDPDTGDERGIIIVRRGHTGLSGTVTYVNWPEYGNW